MFTHTFLNNVIDGETYTIMISFILSPQPVSKSLTMYVNSSFPSYIGVVNNYNVGYFNNTIKNNFLFSNPTTTSNASLSTTSSNDTLIFASNFINTDVVFGLPMYLSVGVWNIEMYTTIALSAATNVIHLMLSYNNSVTPSTVYNSISYYGYVPINGSQLPLKLSCTLIISTNNTYVTPYLRLLTGSTTPLTFKTINTVSGQTISTASGYNITRIA